MPIVSNSSNDTTIRNDTSSVISPMQTLPPEGLLDGEVYDLDRRPPFAFAQLRLARLRINRYPLPRWLLNKTGPRLASLLRVRLRSSPRHVLTLRQPLVVCVAEDLPHNGLRLLMAEWMEYRRRERDAAWTLVIGTVSSDSPDANCERALRFWEHLQALKRQLRVRHARAFLWAASPNGRDLERLLGKADACVSASLGAGLCQAALIALALGKPTVVSRHAATGSLPADYPYTFATGPTTLRFVPEPRGTDRYDPTSTWHMPVPFAIADALARLTNDWHGSGPGRVQAAERAGSAVPSGLYEGVGGEWGWDDLRRQPFVAGRRPVRRESVAT